MKATLKTKIISVSKIGNGEVVLALQTPVPGKVETKALNAQNIVLDGALTLRELIANEMKIGAVIVITVSDEETES